MCIVSLDHIEYNILVSFGHLTLIYWVSIVVGVNVVKKRLEGNES